VTLTLIATMAALQSILSALCVNEHLSPCLLAHMISNLTTSVKSLMQRVIEPSFFWLSALLLLSHDSLTDKDGASDDASINWLARRLHVSVLIPGIGMPAANICSRTPPSECISFGLLTATASSVVSPIFKNFLRLSIGYACSAIMANNNHVFFSIEPF